MFKTETSVCSSESKEPFKTKQAGTVQMGLFSGIRIIIFFNGFTNFIGRLLSNGVL